MKLNIILESLNIGVRGFAISIYERYYKNKINAGNKQKIIITLDSKELSKYVKMQEDDQTKVIVAIVFYKTFIDGLSANIFFKNKIYNDPIIIDIYTLRKNGTERSKQYLIDSLEHELNHAIDNIKAKYNLDAIKKDNKLLNKNLNKNMNKRQTEKFRLKYNYVLRTIEFNQKINQLATIAKQVRKRPIFNTYDELIHRLFSDIFYKRELIPNDEMRIYFYNILKKRFMKRIMREPELAEAYGNVFR
jgi:hypothetical protein